MPRTAAASLPPMPFLRHSSHSSRVRLAVSTSTSGWYAPCANCRPPPFKCHAPHFDLLSLPALPPLHFGKGSGPAFPLPVPTPSHVFAPFKMMYFQSPQANGQQKKRERPKTETSAFSTSWVDAVIPAIPGGNPQNTKSQWSLAIKAQ